LSGSNRPTGVDVLYTNIGRGHPFYLDGVIEALTKCGRSECVRSTSDVFESSGGTSLAAWKLARWLYSQSGSSGTVGKIYRRLRSHGSIDPDSSLIRLLSRDIRQQYTGGGDRPLLVAHPLLVAALRGRRNLLYQHGEMVAPDESVVTGASQIFVPTQGVADVFMKAGYTEQHVTVTGLCVEPSLVEQAAEAFNMRESRLAVSKPLTGAFFSSGAEPAVHVHHILTALRSHASSGGKALVFADAGGRLAAAVERKYWGRCLHTSGELPDRPEGDLSHSVLLATFRSRAEENRLVNLMFHRFDFLVAPSHERSNWALGLGLPMFSIGPAIGPFAPLNRALLLQTGVATEIDSKQQADKFSEKLTSLHDAGSLLKMSHAGWGKLSIDGFSRIADHIASM